MNTPSKTTRFSDVVRTAADIEAIEREPYDELVPATNVLDLFTATAALHGNRPALTLMRSAEPNDIESSMTHSELLASVIQSANLFASLGVQGQDVVAIVAKSHGLVPSLIWGAEVAGVASCLNYLLASDVIAELLRRENAKVLVWPGPVVDPELWARLDEVVAHVPCLEAVLLIGPGVPQGERFVPLEKALASQPIDQLTFSRTLDRDTPAALFHIGGTTGVPKLVMQTHGNQVHSAWALAQSLEMTEQDVALNGLPLFHVGGLFPWQLALLAAGAHVVIVTPQGYRNSEVVRNIWSIVEHFGVTIFGAVPTTIGVMANMPIDGRQVSTLRLVLTGGAAVSPSVADRFETMVGSPLIEQYGMTEAAAAITCTPVRGRRQRGSVGLRHPFSQLRIVQSVDGDRLIDCPPGVRGSVICRGRQVATGYVDAMHDHGAFKDGWLVTGDVGFLTSDQQLVLTGRQKDLIIRSGHNIDPAAIEEIANRHPSVAVSAAVGMPDAYAGEIPVLFVVLRTGQSAEEAELLRYVQERVAEPPARPRHIFVIDKLPLTAVGKVFKPTLREQAISEKLRVEVAAIDPALRIVEVRFGTGDEDSRQVDLRLACDGEVPAPPEVAAALTAALRDLAFTTNIYWE